MEKICARCGKKKNLLSWEPMCGTCMLAVAEEKTVSEIRRGEATSTFAEDNVICPWCGSVRRTNAGKRSKDRKVKTMPDYIERAAVEHMLEAAQIISDGEYCGYCTEDVRLSEIPSVDAESVRRALLTVSRAMPIIRPRGDIAKIKCYDELFTTFEAVTGMSVSDCLDFFLKGYELVAPDPPPTLSGMMEE